MEQIYFEIPEFEKLTDFLDQFCWDDNDKVDIVIRKEKSSWAVLLKEREPE